MSKYFESKVDANVLEQVAKNGFKSVLNLRRANEPNMEKEEEVVAEHGMQYKSSPIEASAEAINIAQLRAAAEVLHSMPQPVFVHCASGGRAMAVVMAHSIIYNKKPSSMEEMGAMATSMGCTYNPKWAAAFQQEFFSS